MKLTVKSYIESMGCFRCSDDGGQRRVVDFSADFPDLDPAADSMEFASALIGRAVEVAQLVPSDGREIVEIAHGVRWSEEPSSDVAFSASQTVL